MPTARIESIRFRSVAFKSPTAKLPPIDGTIDTKTTKPTEISTNKEKDKDGRQHDRERTASWRATKDADQEEPSKTYLSAKEKKRIAFIKQEIHEHVDAVNAYIVFAHPPSPEARPANLPPPPATMDPYEAARAAAESCDGGVFMERTLRVDVEGGKGASGAEGEGQSSSVLPGDPRMTIFVGNLDFASKEEDLRVFFEGLVSAERGPPVEKEAAEEDEEEEDEDDEKDDEEKSNADGVKAKKAGTWVKRVRIIRDKDTQLGKGFAYVQFTVCLTLPTTSQGLTNVDLCHILQDRECVDEILALEPGKVKFAKRKLRVQRCKVIPKGSTSKQLKVRLPHNTAPTASGSVAPASRRSTTGSWTQLQIPRGNPALGLKIQHLPKDERKKVKASDAERVARRAAKKRAKLLAEKGVKSSSKVDRPRVRKRTGERPVSAREKPKRRIRSDKAVSKMNTKKS